jgi:hypothetical protein
LFLFIASKTVDYEIFTNMCRFEWITKLAQKLPKLLGNNNSFLFIFHSHYINMSESIYFALEYHNNLSQMLARGRVRRNLFCLKISRSFVFYYHKTVCKKKSYFEIYFKWYVNLIPVHHKNKILFLWSILAYNFLKWSAIACHMWWLETKG